MRLRLNNQRQSLSYWKRKWQPTPVFLPGEFQGLESLVGCRLGSQESDTTEVTQQQQHPFPDLGASNRVCLLCDNSSTCRFNIVCFLICLYITKQFKMNHRPKCKSQNYKTFKRNTGINFYDLGLSNGFSNTIKKAQTQRRPWQSNG